MKNNSLLAKALSVVLAVAIASTPMTVFAADNSAPSSQPPSFQQISEQVLPPVPSYDSVFRIPNSSIVSITNNGGQYGSSSIRNAIDGLPSTHWETGRANNATFKNVVNISFDQAQEISRINYLVRQDGGRPKGFPMEYIVYYSTSESGEDFQILKQGSFTSSSGNKVAIDFSPTEVRRVRFEFVRALNDWASMAEIEFYKYDAFATEMDALFVDKTYSALTPEFQDDAKIYEMIAKAMQHPNRDNYLPLLQNAKVLIAQPGLYADKIFTTSQRGNADTEKNRTRINYPMYGFDTTGYYVTPGETIQVYVEADPNGIMPQIVFGQIAKDKNDWRRWYTLKPGLNTITAQTQDKMNPAAIYICNPAISSQQAYAPKIRLVGGTKYPMYVHGKTTTEQFQTELEEYMKNVSFDDSDFANGNPNGYYYNIAEITSENNVISTSAAGALTEVNQIVKSGKTVEECMDGWERFYELFATYSGYEMEDESSPNYRPRGKFMSRVFCQGPYGWADVGYTGYNGGNTPKRDSGFFSSMIQGASNGGWATAHEWGHIYDNNLLGRGESTNNLYSLIIQDEFIGKNRMVQDNRWESHFTNYHNTKKYPNDQLFYGAITYQLQGIYGWDLYGKAQKFARENADGILKGLNNNDRLVVSLSKVTGFNFAYHFDYYGETVSDLAKSRIADLPEPGLKTYYVNDKTFAKDAAAFANPESKPVVAAAGHGQITLTMSIDEQSNSVLCYEIYRNGEFAGVTYSNTFVDKNTVADSLNQYTVIAYDRKLNPSPVSEIAVINPSAPQISVSEQVTLKLYDEFDPLAGITAVDSQGNDLTSEIEVTENTVNTALRGEYTVSYRVTDAKGNSTEIQTQAVVVSDYDYLSDQQQTSAKVAWGKFQKDKSPRETPIRLYNQGREATYPKGIGAHANSEVVYNIAGKGYNSFEAFVGIDQVEKGNVNSSAKFEVWVDGVKQYESGKMLHNTSQKLVKVDVSNASEIKLITNDCGDNHWGDQTVWADAKFIKVDSAPVINANDQAFMPDETVDIEAIIAEVTATDVEDGDLSENVAYTTDYVDGATGSFTITYTVTDSDGNTTEKITKLDVVNAFTYVSDVNWTRATIGYGQIQKDTATGGSIRLRNDDGSFETYAKGIGTHAHSEITYDLTNKPYRYFTSYVGINGSGNGNSSVAFKVYVDDKLVAETPVMRFTTPKQFISVNLAGAKTLKLVATDGSNGNANDHANWADAKFLIADDQVDKANLEALLAEIDMLIPERYTPESWVVLLTAKPGALAVIDNPYATKQEVSDAIDALSAAKQALVLNVDKTLIQAAIETAEQVEKGLFTDESWSAFVDALSAAKAVRDNADAAQTDVDTALQTLENTSQALKERPGNKMHLILGTDVFNQFIPEEFTEDSWAVFAKALALANETIEDPDATQREINFAIQQSVDGYKQLVKAPPVLETPEEPSNPDVQYAEFSSSTGYKNGDIISYNGSLYILVAEDDEPIVGYRPDMNVINMPNPWQPYAN